VIWGEVWGVLWGELENEAISLDLSVSDTPPATLLAPLFVAGRLALPSRIKPQAKVVFYMFFEVSNHHYLVMLPVHLVSAKQADNRPLNGRPQPFLYF
jgi:hypothetical protein